MMPAIICLSYASLKRRSAATEVMGRKSQKPYGIIYEPRVTASVVRGVRRGAEMLLFKNSNPI